MTPRYPPGSTAGDLEDVFGRLIDRQMAARERMDDAEQGAASDKISRTYPHASRSLLTNQFAEHPVRGDFSRDRNGYIHLEPANLGGFIYPVMTFAYNWKLQVLRLRVALFGFAISQDDGGQGRRGLKATGFRFETPECWDDADRPPAEPAHCGDHDYFHCQPILSLDKGSPPAPFQHRLWLNVTQPAFPLEAQNLEELMLCMMLAVYGGTTMQDAEATLPLRPLTTRVRAMNCMSPTQPSRPQNER